MLFVFFIFVDSKPVEESKSLTFQGKGVGNEGEMMEAAESQNPFLPRFAMKRLRERSEKINAQRRNYLAQRRTNAPQRIPCPIRYYVSRYYLVL